MTEPSLPSPRGPAGAWSTAGTVLAVYGLTTAVFLLGIAWGLRELRPAVHSRSPDHVPKSGNAFFDALLQWDGQWYLEIATQGYRYAPDRPSSPAFFPLYPVLGRLTSAVTGSSAGAALLLVSHVCLIGAMAALCLYARGRYDDEAGALSGPHGAARPVAPYALLALAFFPTTLFARIAYSEALFLFLCGLTMLGIQRKWNVWAVAAVVGLATAARSVGVALLLPLAVYAGRQGPTRWRAAGRCVCLAPVACSGLLAYVAFLGLALGEPLALVKAQRHWQARPPVPLGEKVLAYASWEPLWSVYDPASPAWWRRFGDNPVAAAMLQPANPVYLVLGVVLVALGAAKRWLNAEETLLAAGLLLIPYWLRGYDTAMMGQGRFVGAVLPVYLVLGNLLARAPRLAAGALLALSAFFLALYAAMLAAGYFFV